MVYLSCSKMRNWQHLQSDEDKAVDTGGIVAGRVAEYFDLLMLGPTT